SRTGAGPWRHPQRVIAVSDAVAHRLRTVGVRPERIRVIPSAIDIDEVIALPPASPTLRERLLIPPDAFLIGNVGPLLPVKHQVLIPRIAARLRDLQWVIIGEGPERHAILEAIKAHGVGPMVRLPGRLPDARRYLQELDAFIFPSVDEALGTSVLDAMARGVPVIAAGSAGPAVPPCALATAPRPRRCCGGSAISRASRSSRRTAQPPPLSTSCASARIPSRAGGWSDCRTSASATSASSASSSRRSASTTRCW